MLKQRYVGQEVMYVPLLSRIVPCMMSRARVIFASRLTHGGLEQMAERLCGRWAREAKAGEVVDVKDDMSESELLQFFLSYRNNCSHS